MLDEAQDLDREGELADAEEDVWQVSERPRAGEQAGHRLVSFQGASDAGEWFLLLDFVQVRQDEIRYWFWY